MRELLIDQLPTELVGYDWHQFGGELADAVNGEAFDLVWLDEPPLLLAPRRTHEVPSICDMDDVEHVRVRRAAALRVDTASIAERVKTSQRRRAWKRLAFRVIHEADVTLVCTADDAEALASPRVAVVPNCIGDPGRVPPPTVPQAMVLLLGAHTYGPNADAASHFVDEVMPCIRRAGTSVQVEIVGRAGGRVQRLAAHDVTIVGEVEDPSPWFARAGVLAVPIRYGGGSRLKIIEAWARGVPVVSTTIGAEGLEVTHGVELLIADSPEDFAAACLQVIADPGLAATLIANGRRRYDSHHTPEVFFAAVDSAVAAAQQRRSARA